MPFAAPFESLAAALSSASGTASAAAVTLAETAAAFAAPLSALLPPPGSSTADAAALTSDAATAALTYGATPSYRVFDLDRLGVTLYFLATVYGLFFVLSVYRNIGINRFSTQAVTEKVLYRAVSVHLAIRTLGFATLSFFNLAGRTNDVWYPLLALLFTLPEQCTISIYIIVFLTWLENYVFSHAQHVIRSRVRFRSIAWLCFFLLTVVQFAVAFILYFLLAINKNAFDDSMGNYIQWSCACINTLFPVIAIAVALVFIFGVLKNVPLASPLAKELVHKISIVFTVWSAGRIVRGVIFILSIEWEWQQTLATNLLGITIVSILVVSEFVPLLLLLDWAVIGILLIGDEIAVDPAIADEGPRSVGGALGLNDSRGAYGAFTAPDAYDSPLLAGARDDSADPHPTLSLAVARSGAGPRSGVSSHPRIDLAHLTLPRAFFTGSFAQADVAAAAASANAGVIPPASAQQVFCDTGVWTTAVGVLDDLRVLVKRFRLEGVRPVSVDELASELDEKSRVLHPRIVRFIGVARQNNHVYAVSEYVARRSLYDLLRQTTKDLSPVTIVRIASEVASAMEALHARGQIHVHLKSRNVLLDEDMSIRLCDVGVKTVKTFAEVMLGHRFLTAWSAPESLLGATPTKASDVYSFGVLCWELTVRQEPFQGLSVQELVETVGKNGTRLKVPTPDELALRVSNGGGNSRSLSPLFLTMLGRCFLQPDLRPSFTDIRMMLTRCQTEMSGV
jgi:hypothetical protein